VRDFRLLWAGRRAGVAVVAAAGLVAAGCREPVPDPPKQITESVFEYPDGLWDQRIEGETMLEIAVNAEGGVDSVRVQEASGHAAFDSAAVAGARKLRFEPARLDGEAVAIRVRLPVQFRLPEVEEVAVPLPGDTTLPVQGGDTAVAN
jgi:protein TonB